MSSVWNLCACDHISSVFKVCVIYTCISGSSIMRVCHHYVCFSECVSVFVYLPFFLYKTEHNMWTKIQEYLSWKVSVTSFNDKTADELFMVLLRVCISVCVSAYVCVVGVAGVNNSEKKPFVFRGWRQRHIWNIWEEITLKAVSSKLMVTDAKMSG